MRMSVSGYYHSLMMPASGWTFSLTGGQCTIGDRLITDDVL